MPRLSKQKYAPSTWCARGGIGSVGGSDDGRDGGHLYLIREREFVRGDEAVFKIGKSINLRGRMSSYPKASCMHVALYTKRDVHVLEKELIAHFDKTFVNRSDIGREYYQASSTRRVTGEFVAFLITRIWA